VKRLPFVAVAAILLASLFASALPAPAEAATPTAISRLAGADRYATAAAITAASYAPGRPVAYVATGAAFPDALAGAVAAARSGNPLVLVGGREIPASTAAELSRLRPAAIVILGGTGTVSAGVASSLKPYATGGVVTRLAGADRYATASAISRHAFPAGAGVVFIATGANFPDALAAGPAAARAGGPLLLVTTSSIPGSTAEELRRLRPAKIVVVGGTSVVAESVFASLRGFAPSVTRLAGADRYSTAAIISGTYFGAGAAKAFVATGLNFPDALAGAAVAGRDGAPVLLSAQQSLHGATAGELRRLDPAQLVMLGGSATIGDGALTAIRNALGQGGDYKLMPWKNTAVHQQETSIWCVPASIRTMLDIAGTSTSHTQSTIYNYGRTQMGYSIGGPGLDPQAWARALNYYSLDRVSYVDSTYGSYDAAIRAAVSAMRSTGRSAGITINNGTHAWVIAGFLTSNDPALTTDYVIRGVYIVASYVAWTDPAPGTFYSHAALRSKMTPYHEAERWTRWNGTYVVIRPTK
jgi:putative cell wall-binding protein